MGSEWLKMVKALGESWGLFYLSFTPHSKISFTRISSPFSNTTDCRLVPATVPALGNT